VVTPPETRAEVLRVMLVMTGGIPSLDPAEARALGALQLTRHDVDLLSEQCDDDLALLNACLQAEDQIRGDAFAALERLLPLFQWAEGPLQERVLALPAPMFARAALGLYELGWINRSAED
jgi:hypothetical protein